MGPRSRRRAIAGSGVLGVVAAVVTVVWVALGSSSGGGTTTTTAAGTSIELLTPIVKQLSFGMTGAQVRRRVGSPSGTFRDPGGMNCWKYGVKVPPALRARRHLIAVAVCFFSNRYAEAHYKASDGKWDYQRPRPKIGR